MSRQTGTESISFEATLISIESSTLLRLPAEASQLLPSRGQVAAHASLNGHECDTVLEPDGVRGHWMRADSQLCQAADIVLGDSVSVAVRTTRDWPEPAVPADLAIALAGAPPTIRDVWNDITSMARWEWVRWIDATANPTTRQRRVDVTISKIDHGKRRPCCFDLSGCTDPAVSRNGKLRGAT